MNPMPLDVKARILSLAIDEADDTASLDVALGMARQCGLKQPAAREIVGEVQSAVTQWRSYAASYGLNARDVARMASAFVHEVNLRPETRRDSRFHRCDRNIRIGAGPTQIVLLN